MDSVKHDMRIKRVSIEMTSDRREWKNKTYCADPTEWDKGTMMMMKKKMMMMMMAFINIAK
jgi:hypothetical protein